MLMIRNEDAMMKGCLGEKRRRPGRHQDVSSRQRGGWGRGGEREEGTSGAMGKDAWEARTIISRRERENWVARGREGNQKRLRAVGRPGNRPH